MALLRTSAVFLAVAVCFLAICHVEVDGAAAAGPRTTAATRLKKTQSTQVKAQANHSDRREEEIMIGVGSTYSCPQGSYRYGTTTTNPTAVTCPGGAAATSTTGTAGGACCKCQGTDVYTFSSTCPSGAQADCCKSCGASAGNLGLPASTDYKCPCAGGYGGGAYSTAVATACTKCGVNTYSPANSGPTYASGSVTCTNCPAGRYTNGLDGQTSCQAIVCPANQYLVSGGTSPAQCTSCDSTSTDGTSSSSVFQCKCKPGYGSFNTATGACTKCSTNFWSAGGDGALCAACATGSSAGTDGSTSDNTACKCKVGYGAQAAGYVNGQPFDCTICPSGSFSLGYPLGKVCSSCTTNTNGGSATHATASLTSSGASSCVCDAGYGFFRTLTGSDGIATYTYGCTQCASGRYSAPGTTSVTNGAGGICTDCGIGKYNPDAGKTSESDCKTCETATTAGASTCPGLCATSPFGICCPKGQKVVPGTTPTCTPCAPGEHTNGLQNGEASCSACTSGKFSTAATMSTGVCASCSAGFASSVTTTDCDVPANACLSANGQYSAPGAGTCSTCTGNQGYAVSGAVGVAGCKGCTAGQRVTDTNSGCTPCDIDTSASVNGDATAGTAQNFEKTCPACQLGYVAQPGSASCTLCTSGTFAPQAGGSCQNCDAGKDTGGASGFDFFPAGADPCVGCTAGTFKATAGSASCGACASGSVGPGTAVRLACSDCSAGTFARTVDQTCQSCTDGSVSTGVRNAACTDCGAGKYSGSFSTTTGFTKVLTQACATCPTGYYSTGTQNLACTRCPNNFLASGSADHTSQAAACTSCTSIDSTKPFAIHSTTDYSLAATCTACGVNQFTPVGDGTCTNCEAGQKGVSTTGASFNTARADACTTCPVGTTSVAGQSCLDCPLGQESLSQSAVLNAGATGDHGLISVCVPCGAGEVHSLTQGTGAACQLCNQGSQYAGPDPTKDCSVCADGYVNAARTSCTKCPINTSWKVTADGASGQAAGCNDCSANKVSLGGTGTCQLCPAGFQKKQIAPGSATTIDDLCEPCPAGTYRSLGQDTACLACPFSTFSTGGASVCATCGNGRQWSATITNSIGNLQATSDSVCTDCPAGWVAAASFEGYVCTQCTTAGTYSPAGAHEATCRVCSAAGMYVPDSNAECKACDNGYQFVAGYTLSGPAANGFAHACQACTTISANMISTNGAACTLCPGGQERSGPGSCSNCLGGYYRAATLDAPCQNCPANSWCASGVSVPTACTPAATMFSPINSDDSSDCQLCGANHYVVKSNSPAYVGGGTFAEGTCQGCPAGYTGTGGLNDCTLCPAGRAGFGAGLAGQGCQVCSVDTINALYAPNPVPTNTPNVECKICPPGSIVNAASLATTCITCSAGRYNRGAPAITCEPCDAGTSTNGVRGAVDNVPTGDFATLPYCIACAAGTYAPTSGIGTCNSCSPGKWMLESKTGSIDSSDCQSCLAGRFSAAGGAHDVSATAACTACTAGYFQPSSGQSSCADEANKCPAGSYSAAGASTCITCPAGKSAPTAATPNSCYSCAPGRYSGFTGGTDLIYTAIAITSNRATASAAVPFVLTATVKPNAAGFVTFEDGGSVVAGCQNLPLVAGASVMCEQTFVQLGATAHTFTAIFTPDDATLSTATSSTFNAQVVSSSLSATADADQTLPSLTSTPNLPTTQAACAKCGLGTFAAGTANKQCTNCPLGRVAGTEGSATCTKCLANTFSNAAQGTSCTVCPVGTTTLHYSLVSQAWSATDANIVDPGASSCQSCPSGYAREFAQTSEFCANCAEGKFAAGVGAICSSCPAGRFGTQVDLDVHLTTGVVGDKVTISGCVSCPEGKYTPTIGLKDCTACPIGRAVTFDVQGSNLGSSICGACTAGKYQDEVQKTSCKECEAGKASVTTERTTTCDICPTGKFSVGNQQVCTSCLDGSYQDTTQSSACKICPAGTGSSDASRIFCTPCAAGTYKSTTTYNTLQTTFVNSGAITVAQCDACQPGYYQDLTGQTSCKPCPIGTYRASGDATACLRCDLTTGYAAAFSTTPGTGQTTFGAACEACPAGKYSAFSSSTGQVECTLCPTGKYNNAVAQSVCTSCEEGRYGLIGDALGQTLKDYDATASTVLKGACRRCPAGRSSTTIGLTSATIADACTICLKGTYQDQPGQLHCAACDLGRYSPLDGALGCTDCETGKYGHQTGLTECFNCELGTFGATTKQSACASCGDTLAAGYAAVKGLTACHGCLPGRYGIPATALGAATLTSTNFLTTGVSGDYPAGTGTDPLASCVACPGGRYGTAYSAAGTTPTTLTSQCALKCDTANYSPRAATICSACGGNIAGTTPFDGYNADSWKTCTGCAAGKYGDAQGTSCSLCPTGTTSVQSEARVDTDCTNCPIGKYSDSSRVCQPCAVNTWSTADGASLSCSPCDANYDRTDINDADGCNACVAPEVSTAGSACSLCPTPGEGVVSGSTTCVPCNDASNPFRVAIGGECVLCPSGTEIDLANLNTAPCKPCQAGTYRTQGSETTCTPCGADKYTLSTGSGYAADDSIGWATCTGTCTTGERPVSNVCTACEPGSAELATAAGSCTPCAGALEYQDGTGATTCKTADAGYEVDLPDHDGQTACGVGHYRADPATTCQVCPVGTWYDVVNGATGSCPACPTGEIRAAEADTGCSPCSGGSFPNPTGLPDPLDVAKTKCVPCGTGQETNAGATGCDPCAEGWYRKENSPEDAVGQPDHGKCIMCGPNADTPAVAALAEFGAAYCSCKPGFTRKGADVTAPDRAGLKCLPNPCSEGQFLPQTGVDGDIGMCTPCPINTWCNNPQGCIGQCEQCDAKAQAAEGQAQCRCKNSGSTYPTNPFGYLPLGSGDQPSVAVTNPSTASNNQDNNVDNGANCLPACKPGQFFVYDDSAGTVAVAASPIPLTKYTCYDAPANYFCPQFMTYGCAGSTYQTALETCTPTISKTDDAVNGGRGATKCICTADYVDLDGSADGSGCVLKTLVTRR